MTLVLMVGGYVTFDRMCRSDPVCRGQGAPDAATIHAGTHAADPAPAQPVAPAPVFALRPDDGSRPIANEPVLTAAAPPDADTGKPARATGHATARTPGRAATTLARHAPVRGPDSARGGIRVADWKGGVPARRPHAVRRVSTHARHGHRAAATETQLAELYRGH
ncbi:hypothetical protein F7R21_03190 [Burkholderia latens]|uniref:Uncharacterized protein n=1 Tax=Burkholderia latens TaxID=488446 RepID=A0A6H9T613_9BURK|nr:hypothetical protein F7R21_03190 [Burkholderia latens]